MTSSTEVTTVSHMDVEFNEVSSENKLLVHISYWHKLSIKSAVNSQSIKHLLLLYLLLHHHLLLHYWLLHHHWLLHHRSWLNEENLFFIARTESIEGVHELRLLHLNNNSIEVKTFLCSTHNMSVGVLEAKAATLVEPYLEMGIVRE